MWAITRARHMRTARERPTAPLSPVFGEGMEPSFPRHAIDPDTRPLVSGKFLSVAGEKLYVNGVTYGAFRPDAEGREFHDPAVIDRDFALMAKHGMTCVRIPHTTPPRYLLDIAARHGLRVMVGLSAEQYVGYLIDKQDAPDLDEIVRAKVRSCAGHPALLCYAIGNEIPASIVRWLGRRTVERYLERIYRIVKEEDPGSLVTYVNYPSTEYLQLPFLDLVCFNVYLEEEDRLRAYLRRLQNLAGNRPLILSEVGLDSLRNGQARQAHVLDWQIRAAFEGGCAGVFIFSWTDEWYRGGEDVDDWAFGITDRDRNPKPALQTVRRALADVPLPRDVDWPTVSVVVCTHNGARTLAECCEGLARLEYPDFEVIVVDDGSSDQSASIARGYGFQVISAPHGGLSNARNLGWKAATGEIVAYIDDDAYPDPHWLHYMAESFLRTSHAGIGGPNLTPSNDGPIANCVANAPGNPTHVLLTDELAEHIPGCNMAFRRSLLEAVGGFDSQFWIAGDDVDICWKLRQQGHTLGFSPAAFVWHHRRNSVRAYWRQQVNYGRAEGLLERKWPEKYSLIGHHDWKGRIYGNGSNGTSRFRTWRVYHGVWGSAPFQSIYEGQTGALASWAARPEWWLVLLALLALSVLGLLWRPLSFALIPLALTLGMTLVHAGREASHASFPEGAELTRGRRLALKGLTAALHVAQPLARLLGRLSSGSAARRSNGPREFKMPRPHSVKLWCETWTMPDLRLAAVEQGLVPSGMSVARGGDFDPWDLEVRGGLFGALRISMAVEDHGSGTQLVRLRAYPELAPLVLPIMVVGTGLALLAVVDQSWLAAGLLAGATAATAIRAFVDCGEAMGEYLAVLRSRVIDGDPTS